MDKKLINKQVVSKKRVADHGEVFTSEREVNAMLDLVKQETERIDSRFLEPACGTGNFLVEILRRKLEVIKNRYKKNQLEYERYAVIAVSSIYGVDWTKERLKPFLGEPSEICTETFLQIGPFENKIIAENVMSYMNTKFFHLLMFLKKISHHVTSKVYQFVPLQDFSQSWTDEKLYKKYGLTQEEIDFIESMIKAVE